MILLLHIIISGWALPRHVPNRRILHRVFSYAAKIDSFHTDTLAGIYTKYRISIEKRNPLLMTVPSLFFVANSGKRNYLGETFQNVILTANKGYNFKNSISISTFPKKKQIMPVVLKYLTPTIYNTTIVDNILLSPFNRQNRFFYRYRIRRIIGKNALLTFTPKVDNTQMVKGSAVVESETGRIVSMQFKGEYDMLSFTVDAVMGEKGYNSLFPKTCSVNSIFSYLGNRLRCNIRSVISPMNAAVDSLQDKPFIAMNSLRPEPLDSLEQTIYTEYTTSQSIDTTSIKKNKVKDFWWNIVGKNLLDNVKRKFGKNEEANLRISPPLNPLFLGYSPRRGITYKFDAKFDYDFAINQNFSIRFNAGYSFKQRQFYFRVPIYYFYNTTRNRYWEIEFGNGNRITNSSVLEQVKKEQGDSINWDNMKLDYFKDTYLKVLHNYDFNEKWGFQLGFTFHDRSPVDITGFNQAGKPKSYRSFAPLFELQYRPFGYSGPIFTADYEQGINKIFGSDSEYARWEFDASYIHKMKCLRSFSARLGGGFYLSKLSNQYFLDYTNFRDNNIPGGWGDEWSGEFELLNSNWYNASAYYIRTNLTYESPLLLLSHIPIVGKIVEKERFYVSTLFVNHLHPYVECGYGFTNRVFSIGAFSAFNNFKYSGFGVKFGIELFSNW